MSQAIIERDGLTIADIERNADFSVNDDIDGDFEIVDGQQVEKPPMSAFGNGAFTNLVISPGQFVREKQPGRIRAEQNFRFSVNATRTWKPDIAFISYERWPKHREVAFVSPRLVVPDLAVEVISQGNLADETIYRIESYFSNGVRNVWVVYPQRYLIYCYASRTSVRILQLSDSLDGGDVLPGLKLPVESLFEDVPSEQP